MLRWGIARNMSGNPFKADLKWAVTKPGKLTQHQANVFSAQCA